MFIGAIPPLILGIAILVAMRLVYRAHGGTADDSLVIVLTIAGWTLIFMAVAILLSPFGLVVALLIFAMTVAKYRDAERQALLWTLSVAADKGMPLAPSARAFAARRCDEMARRAALLADLLENGVPLEQALQQSGNPLPVDAALMIRLGSDGKSLRDSLRASSERRHADEAWQVVFEQAVYIVLVTGISLGTTTFMMIKIVPTIKEIFSDFGTELPRLTAFVIDIANWLAAYWFVFSPFVFYGLAVLLIAAFHYANGRTWVPWPLTRLLGPTDNPAVLRGLAACIQKGMTMKAALKQMGESHPRPDVAIRLKNAAGTTAVGKDWCESLLAERFVSEAQAAVLKAAVRSGNLNWALREMADASTRQTTFRVKSLVSLVVPVCLILVAIPIGALIFGFFLPLVSLIQNLT